LNEEQEDKQSILKYRNPGDTANTEGQRNGETKKCVKGKKRGVNRQSQTLGVIMKQ
jgi:hypothetical protein